MEPTITKRLHISGLTQAISQQDLTQRLSTFGDVKSLDGLGLLDANGQRKRFAYATLEATPSKLSKCLNTLSGSTWKGTKLRLGEAKPDFRERIKRENEKAAAEATEPPRKKLRWKYTPYHAVEAKDMEPLTPEKAKLKAGWIVTPLGRVYRPLRLRPTRPLPRSATTILPDTKGGGKEGKRKVRKPRSKPELRARIRKIDMMQYGSIYLKGKFLDSDVPPGVSGSSGRNDYVAPMEGSRDEGEQVESSEDEGEPESREKREIKGFKAGREEDEAEAEDSAAEVQTEAVPEVHTSIAPQTTSLPIPPPQFPTVQPSTLLTVDFDLEKRHSLGVLASLFGTSVGTADEDDEDHWIGRESLGSDVDEADLVSGDLSRPGEDVNDFEVVPRKNGKKRRQERAAGDENLEGVGSSMGGDRENDDVDQPVVGQGTVKGSPKPQKEPQLKGFTKLKDLFAPTEAEGFSLLGHLNLDDDLDLDEDIPFATTHDNVELSTIPDQPTFTPITSLETQSHSQKTQHTPQITLDPSKPLFFPLALLSSHPSFASSSFPTNPNAKNRPKDVYDTLKANGQDWRTAGFYRTQSEDEIRQRWEEQKGELTVGWKKRWREAKRSGRRRGKGDGGDDAP